MPRRVREGRDPLGKRYLVLSSLQGAPASQQEIRPMEAARHPGRAPEAFQLEWLATRQAGSQGRLSRRGLGSDYTGPGLSDWLVGWLRPDRRRRPLWRLWRLSLYG